MSKFLDNSYERVTINLSGLRKPAALSRRSYGQALPLRSIMAWRGGRRSTFQCLRLLRTRPQPPENGGLARLDGVYER